jgi:Rrf2 family protein
LKLITRDTDYAIRAVCCIAGSGRKVVSAQDLTKELGIPCSFMRKILQELNKHNVLRSYKGKGGGFSLFADPDEINVFDIIEIFQGPFKLNEHIFKGDVCPYLKLCLLKKRLDKVERSLIEKLKAITVSSLLVNGKSIWNKR